METVINIGIVALGVAFIIFIHELGHFSVAKWYKMKVEAFSIGFGKVIWSVTRGETEYRLSLIPLGGYVKLAGETSDASTGSDDDFFQRPPGQRAAVLVAGVAMNIISGVAMLFAAFLIGIKVVHPEVGYIAPESPAAKAGLEIGDVITDVDGDRVFSFSDFSHKIALGGGDTVQINWERAGKPMSADVTPEYNEGIGFYTVSVMPRPLSIVGAVPEVDLERNPKAEKPPSLIADLQRMDRINEMRIADGDWQPVKYFDEVEDIITASKGAAIGIRGRHENGDDFETTYTATTVVQFGTRHVGGERPNLVSRLFGAEDEPVTLVIENTQKNSPAEKLGLTEGDVLESVAVTGQPAEKITSLQHFVKFLHAHPNDEMTVYWHSDKENKQLSASFRPNKKWQPDFARMQNYVVSSVPAGEPGLLVERSFEKASHDFMGVVRSLKSFLTGSVAAKNINGPISIARVSMHFVELGMGSFLAFLAMISFNLAILNILPIPLLDGGHLVFVAIEKLMGRQVDEKIQIAMQYVGIVLLGSLMFLAFFNDIFRSPF